MKKVYEIEVVTEEMATFYVEADSIEEARAEAERCVEDGTVELAEMEWEPSAATATINDATEVRSDTAHLLRESGEIANA